MTDAMVRLSNPIFQESDVLYPFDLSNDRMNQWRKKPYSIQQSEAKIDVTIIEFDKSDRLRAGK